MGQVLFSRGQLVCLAEVPPPSTLTSRLHLCCKHWSSLPQYWELEIGWAQNQWLPATQEFSSCGFGHFYFHRLMPNSYPERRFPEKQPTRSIGCRVKTEGMTFSADCKWLHFFWSSISTPFSTLAPCQQGQGTTSVSLNLFGGSPSTGYIVFWYAERKNITRSERYDYNW